MRVAILVTDVREQSGDYRADTPRFHPAHEALLQGFRRIPEIEAHVISCTQQPMQSPAKLADNIWFHSLHVPKLGWMRTLYQGCVRAVRRKLREIKPDIVHGQGTERECALAAVLSGCANLVTIHGNMIEMARVARARPGSFHWLAARLENFALRRTGGVLCNSAFTEDLVRSRAQRFWRVPNPVREAFLAPGTRRPLPPKCVVLNVGLVCTYKRQLELLEVARRLHEEGLDVEFRFIGLIAEGGPYNVASTFRQRIEAAEKDGYARYVGLSNAEMLLTAYDEAAALAHVPSAESFGLVVAEGLARNLKFFGTRVGGIPDIAESAEGAELVDDGDWSGLQKAISRWIRLGCQRPRTAAEVMRDRYCPETIARRHLEIYHEVRRGD